MNGSRLPWGEAETLALVRVWGEEMARAHKAEGEPNARSETIYGAFLKVSGKSTAQRSFVAVVARRKRLRGAFRRIRAFNDAQAARGRPSWFELPEKSRPRTGGTDGKRTLSVTRRVFKRMERVFADLPLRFNTPRNTHKTSGSEGGSPAAKLVSWSASELMVLARSFLKVYQAHPTIMEHLSSVQRSEIYATYRRYGGIKTRTVTAVGQQARLLMKAYRFIAAFNAKAKTHKKSRWHNLSEQARATYAAKHTGNGHVLQLMDASMFAMLKETLSAPSITTPAPTSTSTPTRKRSSASHSTRRSGGNKRAKQMKTQAIEVHRVTESRHYSMSTRQTVVSVDRSDGSSSDAFTSSSSDSSEEGKDETEAHRRATRLLRGQLHQQEEYGNSMVARRTFASLASAHGDYLSLLEHTVTTMSTQLAQIDRKLTEERISENQRMLVSVLRACRQSPSFGSAPVALAREMLSRAGDNLEQIVELVGQQKQKDGELLRRLLCSLASNNEASW